MPPFPEDDTIYTYAETLGIPQDWMLYAWEVFKANMIEGGVLQADWRAKFRKYVRNDYLKLWYKDSATNGFKLTTAGLMAQKMYQGAI